jgi:tRNA threonylcarbamoyladenosine biosynthesis protein TsaE
VLISESNMKKIFTQNEIQDIAKEIVASFGVGKVAKVVALSGDLGAGKTTLTQNIARQLGIKENVISPTFVIMKQYKINSGAHDQLIHIDAYRLESNKELQTLGWEELTSNPKNLILIEWPEKVEGLIPEHAQKIFLSHIDENTRQIDF